MHECLRFFNYFIVHLILSYHLSISLNVMKYRIPKSTDIRSASMCTMYGVPYTFSPAQCRWQSSWKEGAFQTFRKGKSSFIHFKSMIAFAYRFLHHAYCSDLTHFRAIRKSFNTFIIISLNWNPFIWMTVISLLSFNTIIRLFSNVKYSFIKW